MLWGLGFIEGLGLEEQALGFQDLGFARVVCCEELARANDWGAESSSGCMVGFRVWGFGFGV